MAVSLEVVLAPAARDSPAGAYEAILVARVAVVGRRQAVASTKRKLEEACAEMAQGRPADPGDLGASKVWGLGPAAGKRKRRGDEATSVSWSVAFGILFLVESCVEEISRPAVVRPCGGRSV